MVPGGGCGGGAISSQRVGSGRDGRSEREEKVPETVRVHLWTPTRLVGSTEQSLDETRGHPSFP